jgi:hypothetical protein
MGLALAQAPLGLLLDRVVSWSLRNFKSPAATAVRRLTAVGWAALGLRPNRR